MTLHGGNAWWQEDPDKTKTTTISWRESLFLILSLRLQVVCRHPWGGHGPCLVFARDAWKLRDPDPCDVGHWQLTPRASAPGADAWCTGTVDFNEPWKHMKTHIQKCQRRPQLGSCRGIMPQGQSFFTEPQDAFLFSRLWVKIRSEEQLCRFKKRSKTKAWSTMVLSIRSLSILVKWVSLKIGPCLVSRVWEWYVVCLPKAGTKPGTLEP